MPAGQTKHDITPQYNLTRHSLNVSKWWHLVKRHMAAVFSSFLYLEQWWFSSDIIVSSGVTRKQILSVQKQKPREGAHGRQSSFGSAQVSLLRWLCGSKVTGKTMATYMAEAHGCSISTFGLWVPPESCLLTLFLFWCESTICLCPFIENGGRVCSFFVSGLNFSLGKSQPDNNNA